jgi:hypothetical protein
MSSVNEVDLPVLMSILKDKLENPDRAWFLEVKLSAREWEKLVKCYYNKKDVKKMQPDPYKEIRKIMRQMEKETQKILRKRR